MTAYPASIAPVAYAAGRGWISIPTLRNACAPAGLVGKRLLRVTRGGSPFGRYADYCYAVGKRHGASD